MYKNNNNRRHVPTAANIPLPDITMPSPASPLALPGEPNPENKPGLIPLFQYMSSIYQQYIKAEENIGYLKAGVNSALDGRPIAGAKITISKPLGNNTFFSQIVFTDATGQTPEVMLPTRSLELSQTSVYPVPYSVWDLMAQAPGYNDVVVYDVSVFPGVLTTQSFSMKPLEGGAAPRPEEIYATARQKNSFGRLNI